jgi:hypothetical protein
MNGKNARTNEGDCARVPGNSNSKKGSGMTFRVFLAALVAGFALHAQAQTISQPIDVGGAIGGDGIGQTFTATTTGTITAIRVRGNATATFNLLVYNGGVGSGTAGLVGAPAYTQAGVVVNGVASNGAFTTITLTAPFPITAGQQYTFVFQDAPGGALFWFHNVDPYAGGQVIVNYGDAVFVPGGDLAFEVVQAAAVPTLDAAALVLLALAMAAVAFRIRR